MNLEAARTYIYHNARPIDLMRWRYHFENGSREDVLAALAYYQNEDGGFGHALEPDCHNPASTPIQTWCATEILREIGVNKELHLEMIDQILQYLEHSKDFDGKGWAKTVIGNEDYPHAPWWSYPHSPWWSDTPETQFCDAYNPTACLAGFCLYYAQKESSLYQKAYLIARTAIDALNSIEEITDMHVISCFIGLLEYLELAGLSQEFDTAVLSERLMKLVETTITKDKDAWNGGYLCRPSQYFNTKDSRFYRRNQELADYEVYFIEDTQLSDGSWEVTWSWQDYPETWAVSKNWWKSDIIIKNCLYWHNMRM